ncbi:TPA: hypothetical protein ACJFV9_004402 [Salmonella enterica subsp. enterica serovar Infantis]
MSGLIKRTLEIYEDLNDMVEKLPPSQEFAARTMIHAAVYAESLEQEGKCVSEGLLNAAKEIIRTYAK